MKNPLINQKFAGLALAAVAGSVLFAGCGSDSDRSAAQMTSYESKQPAADTANLFTVPQDQMAHIQVVPVQKQSIERELRLTGTVTYNAFKTTPVFSPIGGPVAEILVAPGEHVSQGQTLLKVNSPDYALLRASYAKARDAYELADKSFKRSQDLYQHHAIAEADLQAAESVRTQAQADMQSSEDALRALGVKDPDALLKGPPSAQIPVIAPVGGEITDRLVGPGQLLQAATTQCFTISDLSTVWVLVNVYQNDLAAVRSGDSVEITTDAYPDKFHGRISYIAATVDPNTRTLQARIVTENPGEKLKNNMYVTATVKAGAVKNALIVPDSAVLRDTENMPFVYVQAGSNQFARRLVQIGESEGGKTRITDGLKEGERVVGDGSLFLQFRNSLQH
ncbi:MAG TPA: efflux RND transporter periplasmic adaptor subunit [Candidatus Acidoferrales bacterium]|nr:efflux RND transporter periplasmic adaptor subunit [Candidatus Acidoferrales bacterium]